MTATTYRPRERGGPDLRGNTTDRRRRREWLLTEWRADVDMPIVNLGPSDIDFRPADVPLGCGEPACRCYRCGQLLTIDTLTVDRIDLGKRGGRYTRDNVRPACEHCNKSMGAQARGDDEGRPW